MLKNEHLYILHLLRKSMLQESVRFDDKHSTFDIDEIANIILRNGIILTVYPTLKHLQDNISLQLQTILSKPYLSALRQSILQGVEGERILSSFAANGIDCIALKGWVLRKLYPDENMRSMADIDILVLDYNYSKISNCMNELGFYSPEETTWKHDDFYKGTVTVETHKRLTDESGCIYNWEQNMRTHILLEKESDHLFIMTDEDYYIYNLLHMFRDFKNGVLGLRRIVDSWVLNKTHPTIDHIYLDSELEKLGIDVFRQRIELLSKVCIDNVEMDENSELLLLHAMKYGMKGSRKSYKTSRIALRTENSVVRGKIKSLKDAIFPPIEKMKQAFPILNRQPVLLPVCWGKRLFKHIRNFKYSMALLDYSDISKDDVDELRKYLKAGGAL